MKGTEGLNSSAQKTCATLNKQVLLQAIDGKWRGDQPFDG